MKDLNRFVTTIYATDWYEIGIELKVDLHELNIIKQANPQQRVDCFQNTLGKWLQSTSNDVTWKTLEIALTNVNRANLELNPVDVNGKYIL